MAPDIGSAAAAVGFGGKPAPRRMILRAWRPMIKGALRGFATVELPIGLKIHDVPVLTGANGPWANLPSKPWVEKDGRQKIGADGKALYSVVVEWRDKALRDAFSAAVIGLVRAAHPDAFDD